MVHQVTIVSGCTLLVFLIATTFIVPTTSLPIGGTNNKQVSGVDSAMEIPNNRIKRSGGSAASAAASASAASGGTPIIVKQTPSLSSLAPILALFAGLKNSGGAPVAGGTPVAGGNPVAGGGPSSTPGGGLNLATLLGPSGLQSLLAGLLGPLLTGLSGLVAGLGGELGPGLAEIGPALGILTTPLTGGLGKAVTGLVGAPPTGPNFLGLYGDFLQNALTSAVPGG